MLFLFNTYYTETCLAFAGLILGCIPSILKQSGKITYNKIIHWILLILTFALSIFLIALESINITGTFSTPSFYNLIIGGILMSAGVVIPGVSKSVILMILGLYTVYLNAIASINISVLFPLGLGVLIGGFIFLKIINFLFSRYKTYTYYAIAGFSLGSVFVIIPPVSYTTHYIIGSILFIISLIVSYYFSFRK